MTKGGLGLKPLWLNLRILLDNSATHCYSIKKALKVVLDLYVPLPRDQHFF